MEMKRALPPPTRDTEQKMNTKRFQVFFLWLLAHAFIPEQSGNLFHVLL
jgi:hypothetical protein